MAGNKGNVISQGPELIDDRIDQGVVIAPGKVCAPNRALEQYIPHQGQTRQLVVENNMARRVTRTVLNRQLLRPSIGGTSALFVVTLP